MVAERLIRVQEREAVLEGTLGVPEGARGVVLFAHGSGSSRHSSRNRYVAERLRAVGLGTLLLDLLTAAEEEAERFSRHLRFDLGLLDRRLQAAVDWLRADSATAALPVGLFGASTGGGAALVTAAHRPNDIAAVVSRGGRPDLAGEALPAVKAPTLLIVGSRDDMVLALNRQALAQLTCPKELAVVPGATHLFEEPGTLEEVARLAGDWLVRWLRVEG